MRWNSSDSDGGGTNVEDGVGKWGEVEREMGEGGGGNVEEEDEVEVKEGRGGSEEDDGLASSG